MDKTRAGYIEGIVSIVLNAALFVLKLWAGAYSVNTGHPYRIIPDTFLKKIAV